jgi:hypothetical protein
MARRNYIIFGPDAWPLHRPAFMEPAPPGGATSAASRCSTGGMEPDVGAQDSRRASITQGAMQSKDQAMQEQKQGMQAADLQRLLILGIGHPPRGVRDALRSGGFDRSRLALGTACLSLFLRMAFQGERVDGARASEAFEVEV